MKIRRASDRLLTASVAGGLFFPPLLGGLFAATLLRGRLQSVRWRLHHSLMAAAVGWAVLVVTLFRPSALPGIAYFGYLWMFPFLLAVYKPDADTVRTFGRFIIALFVVDLGFNVYSFIFGTDLLGRTLDAREGLFAGARNGGVFAHSFYSGSISIAALIVVLGGKRAPGWALLPLLNLAAAGSWRLGLAAMVILSANLLWHRWTRRGCILFIAAWSLAVVISVVATSGLLPIPVDANLSNTNRVFAWLLAIDKLQGTSLLGVGIPNTSGIEAVTFETIDENLIAESWYLGTALAFGLPYTLLSFCALASAFFGQNFKHADKQFALLMPLVFIDMVAGEFFLGVLIYTWMWLLIGCNDGHRGQRTAAGSSDSAGAMPQAVAAHHPGPGP